MEIHRLSSMLAAPELPIEVVHGAKTLITVIKNRFSYSIKTMLELEEESTEKRRTPYLTRSHAYSDASNHPLSGPL
jgi:hypothetical protein